MTKSLFQFIIAVCLGIFLSACSSSNSADALPKGSTVLILGDSLTQGVGSSGQDHAYPSLLAKASGWNVVNGGISGNTSAQALERLPALLQQHQPKLVIISIGGNDFLQRKPNSETESNIRQSIILSQKSGAQVLLVAVPYLSLAAAIGRPSDHALYEKLAKENKVPLLSQAWSDVLGQESLKADAVHANDAGYQVFHEKLLAQLKKSGWLP